ncbi:MAG: phosphoribosylglycinamide formyltransferase [Proteobacteria bacterium]|nr:phosphoribosylglycinamide formyltransferase [Pseudomonadota bacterium]
MQALVEAAAKPDYPAEVCAVISNKADAKGLVFAAAKKIPTHVLDHKTFESRDAFDTALHDLIKKTGAEFVCLAGFMRLLTPGFTRKWEGKMINIHPSLLPLFKGAHAQRDAIEAGAKESGCTVHFVVAEMDSGPIIAQAKVPVLPGDTEETLSARILKEEHTLYPAALAKLARGEVRM